ALRYAAASQLNLILQGPGLRGVSEPPDWCSFLYRSDQREVLAPAAHPSSPNAGSSFPRVRATRHGLRGGVAVVRGQAHESATWHQRLKRHLSGLFLGLYLDDEVNVVSDRTQIGLHSEIRALKSAAGGKARGVNLVERVLPDFVHNNVECN